MTDSLRDRIAMTLLEHRFVITGCTDQPMCCACQEGCSDAQGHMLAMDPLLHDDHIADAILALPGIAVVELPEPSEFADMWLHGNVHAASPSTHPGTPVALEIDPGSPVCFSIEYARDLAAALLAAAEYAEREQ